MQYDGLLIAVEGIDGSGKTTLIERLAKALKEVGQEPVLTKEPGGSAFLGKQLRMILQDHPEPLDGKAEFLLFAADRAQHFEKLVIPALKKGDVVITDRCADSSLAYQGYGHSVDRSMIVDVNHWVMQGVKPDIVFYLRVDLATACKRLMQTRETLTTFEQKEIDFWQRVIQGYDEIFRDRAHVYTLDATQNEEEVFTHAWNCLVSGVQHSSLGIALKNSV